MILKTVSPVVPSSESCSSGDFDRSCSSIGKNDGGDRRRVLDTDEDYRGD